MVSQCVVSQSECASKISRLEGETPWGSKHARECHSNLPCSYCLGRYVVCNNFGVVKYS